MNSPLRASAQLEWCGVVTGLNGGMDCDAYVVSTPSNLTSGPCSSELASEGSVLQDGSVDGALRLPLSHEAPPISHPRASQRTLRLAFALPSVLANAAYI